MKIQRYNYSQCCCVIMRNLLEHIAMMLNNFSRIADVSLADLNALT